MAVGINALHKMGIIHKDIKPENILLYGSNNIKIFDYGTAYVHHEAVTHGNEYSFDIRGTEPYLAPERRESKKYGPAVDYWALGCTMFAIITNDVGFMFPSSFFVRFPWRGIRADIFE